MGLRAKLLLPVLLGFGLFAVVLHFYWSPAHLRQERAAYEENQKYILVTLEPEITRALLSGDLAVLYAFLDWQMNLHQGVWRRLELHDARGKRLYPLTERSGKESGSLFRLSHPIRYEEQPLATVTATIDWQQEEQAVRARADQIERLALFLFGFIVIGGGFLQNHFIRTPLLRLKQAAVKLADGDFEANLPRAGRDELGQLTRAFASMRQHIEMYRAELEDALQMATASEARHRAVLENMADGLITIDAHGIVESFNQAAERIFGYETAEVVGHNISMLMPEPHASAHDGYLSRYLMSGETQCVGLTREVEGLGKDGSLLPLELKVSEIREGERRIFIGILRDMRERKRAEEELRLAAVAFDTHEGIMITDREANILRVNRAFTTITGFTEEEVIGQNPRIMKSGRQSEEFYRRMWNALLEEGQWSGEIWNRRRNGEIYPQWASITAVRNRQGEISHYVGSFLDISEIKEQQRLLEQKTVELEEARDAAEDAARAKSEFLATMSHEIRTPMNGVLGMTQLLTETKLDREQHEFVQTIDNSGRALLSIINDILDFSKIDAYKMELEPISFDLEQTAFEVTQLLASKAEEKGLELLFHYAPGCPHHLIGDAGRIRQVLLNLVGNAIKFTTKGHVLLEVASESIEPDRVGLRVNVQDTGIGIALEDQERLFDSFSQADSSTTRKFGGTGLGLAISKKLINLMGGEIGVESTPGEGANFYLRFSLPRAEAPEPLPQAGLEGVKTLVVDDNKVNRRLLTEQLKGFGMQVETAADAGEGLVMLRNAVEAGQPFQLGVLDYLMPEMDGEEMGRLIQADENLAGLPLVMLTSAGRRGDAKRFEAAGFSAYLTKPIQRDVLRQTLASVLGVKQQGRDPGLITRYHVTEVQPQAEHTASFHGRVLLAEDDPTNQKVALAVLGKLGFETEVAQNGRQALQYLEQADYDIILMDCQMPEMDGYQATREIREREQTGRIPIIAVTANVQESDRKKCLEAGMDDFLSKPFSREDLVEVLSRWLPQYGSRETAMNAGGVSASLKVKTVSVDHATLETLREVMGEEDFAELLPTYVASTENSLKLLLQHQPQGELAEIERLAHSLKSSSASIGARHLSALAKDLEQQAREGKTEDLKTAIDALHDEFRQLCLLLEAKYMMQRP